MGGYDVPTKPSYQWVPIKYHHEDVAYIHYVNPCTGQYSHYGVEKACKKIIQSMVRNFLNKNLQLPREDLLKCRKLIKTADKAYEERRGTKQTIKCYQPCIDDAFYLV